MGVGPVTVVSNISQTETYLYLNQTTPDNWILANDLAGNGRVRVEDGSYTLTLLGTTISPGTNTGMAARFAITGALAFTNNGPQYAALCVDITDSNNVAGADYDQLVVSGNVTALDHADLRVSIATNLTPAVIGTQTFTIVTCANDTGSGLGFHSVKWPDGWRGAVAYGAGFVNLQNMRKTAAGTIIMIR